MTQKNIKNKELQDYSFLEGMYRDDYFPIFLVDKGKNILIDLCLKIEKEVPRDLENLYKLTHAATEEFNKLDDELGDNESEIETVAREIIAADFDFIAKTYDFDADEEALIEPREW